MSAPVELPRAAPDGLISLQEAARRLGLHYATVYRYLRLGRLPATWAGGRWRVDPRDLALVSVDQPSEAAPRRGRPRAAVYRRRLADRLLAADEAGAWAVVESALVAGRSPQWVLLEALAPVLREIGEGWARGRFTVGDEHRASAVALRLVGRLGPRFARRGRTRGTVVLAGAPDDAHSLPMAILADVLRGEGFSVVDLGGATPTQDVAEVARQVQPLVAVGISVSSADRLSAAKESVGAVRRAVPGVAALVGGPAVPDRGVAEALGADGWAADAAGVAQHLEALMARRRTARPAAG